PVWPLCLGRKAFVPGCPVRLPDAPPYGPGLRPGDVKQVLRDYPWPTNDNGARRTNVRFVLDDPTSTSGIMRQDVPLDFDPVRRRYQMRFVTVTEELPPPDAPGDALPTFLALR